MQKQSTLLSGKKMIDDYLVTAGLAKSRSTSTEFLARSQPGFDSVRAPYGEYIQEIWNSAKRLGIASGPQSGTLFEMLIGSVLIAAGFLPFYQKAELHRARNIESDFLFWDKETESPLCLELTSTLRERYKLADLQAFKIKASYPSAKFFQLTMDFKDAARRSTEDFDSLDGLIFPGSSEIDTVLQSVSGMSLGQSAPLLQNKNTSLHFLNSDGLVANESPFR